MPSRAHEQYRQKLASAAQAAALVKSGDNIFMGEFAQNVEAVDAALALRQSELREVILTTTTRAKPLKCVEADPGRESFIWNDWHFSGLGRKNGERGLASYVPLCYHQGPQNITLYEEPDVVIVQVAPMDANGFFNLSTSCSLTPAYLSKAKKIVVEVNTQAPRCLGGLDESIHISHVDMVVEGPNSPLLQLPDAQTSEADRLVAGHVMNLIEDGSTIQLGIGALPNIVGSLIAQSDLKDLGVHTEMLADSYVDMYQAGRITGKRKAIDCGKMVYTFAMGTQKLYDFLDNNPAAAIFPVSYTNDPCVIGRNPKVVAINNAIEVDLFTQVASESSGARQISGTGGQLDFITGAYRSEGGKGLICINSTFKKKDGTIGSRIVPTLSPGTIVTCPRSIVHYVVTEFGCAQLKAKSTWQRTEALINIAHPDFREQLVKAAEALGIWRRSNKKL
ncbi:butanoate coenzyme A-transferase [Rhodoferax lithotrophicus]|uniref:Probable butyrate:acetyl-CoA coenzyme A-transferase n=1 Tax=Rhodoferax lithotrophicus TaxID=2798804 RepID=A0ABM7MHS8_9BURK|nr:acetyl-CoA hydrolase/transferase C-terminal domain-containing protein [Rhodoferax sp. MIZ03]BCO25734.1 butanoate coenzyme A-transferase [Rhodoferax sp. MIZ03]